MCDIGDPQHLRFVVLAYPDRAQIISRFGRYCQLSIGIGLAGNAYQVGTWLVGLLDSTKIPGYTRMQMYLNDSVKSFEFVLHGELTGDAVTSLEQAWITATSILGGKDVFVDVSALTAADADGMELLCRMTRSGARLTAARPQQSEEFLRSLDVLALSLLHRSGQPWILGVRRLFGLST